LFSSAALLIVGISLGQDFQREASVEVRSLTVSVEEQWNSISNSGLFIEVESDGGVQVARLSDNGVAPDVLADDQRYSVIVPVVAGAFSASLVDGEGLELWVGQNLSIPSEFELPSLRIVATISEVSGEVFDDVAFEPVEPVEPVEPGEPVEVGTPGAAVGVNTYRVQALSRFIQIIRRELASDLLIEAIGLGFVVGVLVAVGYRRRRDPITSEGRLELVDLQPMDDRVAAVVGLVTRASASGPMLLVTENLTIKSAVSGMVGVVTLDESRPTIAKISQFVSCTMMLNGRAVTVIDGQGALSPRKNGAQAREVHHEIERCMSGVVYFVKESV